MADKDISIQIKTTADTAGAESAKRALEEVAQAGERAAAGGASGAPATRGFGGMLDSSPERTEGDTEAVKQKTAAIEEQVEALEDLTDAEAGVIDATKRLNEEAKTPDGFKALFDQQRLQETAREMRELGSTVRDLVQQFAATEAGKEFFGGLSEEARTFGGVALQTGAAVAQGWAAGGPIGAAVAGLNVLVREVGDSFLAVSRAQEEAARSYAAEEARITAQTRERRREAESRAIEQQIQRENDKLEDQSEILREQQGLLRDRKELADATFDLDQAQAAAAGATPEQLEIARVQKELRDKEQEIAQARTNRQNERGGIEVERDARDVRIRNARRRNDPEAVERLERERDELQEQLEDRERADGTLTRGEDAQLEAARRRAAARLTGIATGARGEAARDTERRARDREAAEERARSEGATAESRRQGLGREGEGLANTAARAIAGRSERAARQLEQLGDNLAENPTAAAADELGKMVDKFATSLEGRDAATARKLRDLSQKFDRLEARLKVKGDTP